jgi:DNA integrity scanning protein DisA with diadenylate cyclase activity
MLPGVVVQLGAIPCSAQEIIVLREDERNVLVRPDPQWNYQLRLHRAHPIEKDDFTIIKKFGRAFHEKLIAAGESFFPYLVDKCSQEVVANAVQPRSADDLLVSSVIELLKKWACETYEGQRVSVTIGVDPYADGSRISNVHFTELIERDFMRVLSNGTDTLLVLSLSGHVVEHLSLSDLSKTPSSRSQIAFAPLRHLQLAAWTIKTRVALALNRQGEVLVFRQGQLRFVFRRGAWAHFAHKAMIARFSGLPDAIIRAVYTTCLDVSFARTGGCIAIVEKSCALEVGTYVDGKDLLSSPGNDKARVIDHLVNHPFHILSRTIRQELAGIDGAVIMRWDGTILAVGAIVAIRSGSDGGGRKAAAKALARLGVAIKVSADGGITAFCRNGSNKAPTTVFEICTK